MEKALERPVGDMTLAGLQEALRPAIHEAVPKVITSVREEGFLTRYDRPTEVLISTMAVRIDAIEGDIVEIKARLGRLDSLESHRRENAEDFKTYRQENGAEFKALRQEFEAHRQENGAEFKAVRQEMAEGFASLRQELEAHRQENGAEFKALRQEITELHRMMRKQLIWTVTTTLTVGGLIIAVITLMP